MSGGAWREGCSTAPEGAGTEGGTETLRSCKEAFCFRPRSQRRVGETRQLGDPTNTLGQAQNIFINCQPSRICMIRQPDCKSSRGCRQTPWVSRGPSLGAITVQRLPMLEKFLVLTQSPPASHFRSPLHSQRWKARRDATRTRRGHVQLNEQLPSQDIVGGADKRLIGLWFRGLVTLALNVWGPTSTL